VENETCHRKKKKLVNRRSKYIRKWAFEIPIEAAETFSQVFTNLCAPWLSPSQRNHMVQDKMELFITLSRLYKVITYANKIVRTTLYFW